MVFSGACFKTLWALSGLFVTCSQAMRLVSPLNKAELFSADAVIALEFLPSIVPSPRHPLWFRFFSLEDERDENGILQHASNFTSFGGYGEASEYLFVHPFALPPGRYRLEVRLGISWGQPISAKLIKTLSFTLSRVEDDAASILDNQASNTENGLGSGAEIVVDAFPFHNEFAILVVRLLELSDVVDAFILVESRSTHSGKPKPLYYADDFRHHLRSDPTLAPLEAKVFAVVDDQEPFGSSAEALEALAGGTSDRASDGFPLEGGGAQGGNPPSAEHAGENSSTTPSLGNSRESLEMLRREARQRDYIAVALQKLKTRGSDGSPTVLVGPDSLVLVSDVDEVPRSTTVKALKRCWQRTAAASHQEQQEQAGSPAMPPPHPSSLPHRPTVVAPVRLIMEWYLYSLTWSSRRPWGMFGTEGPFAVPTHMLLEPPPPPSSSSSTVGPDPRTQGHSDGTSTSTSSTSPSSNTRTASAKSSSSFPVLARGTASQWRRALRLNEARHLVPTQPQPQPSSREAPAAVEESPIAVGLGVWSTVADAGWHFSSFGGVDAVRAKLGAYIGAAHFDSDVFRDQDRLQRLLRHGVAYFDLAALGTLKSLPEENDDEDGGGGGPESSDGRNRESDDGGSQARARGVLSWRPTGTAAATDHPAPSVSSSSSSANAQAESPPPLTKKRGVRGGDEFAGFERTPPLRLHRPQSRSSNGGGSGSSGDDYDDDEERAASESARFEASLPTALAAVRQREKERREHERRVRRKQEKEETKPLEVLQPLKDCVEHEGGRGVDSRRCAPVAFMSAAVEEALVDVFGSDAGADGGGEDDNDDDEEVKRSQSDGPRAVADKDRELFLLNQDIRWARQHSTNTGQFVADAYTSDDPHRLRLLTRHELHVADCSAPQEPRATVDLYCARHAFPPLSCAEVHQHAASACKEVVQSPACVHAKANTRSAQLPSSSSSGAPHHQHQGSTGATGAAAAAGSGGSDSTGQSAGQSLACAHVSNYELDLSRRFDIVVGEDKFLVEVAPWEDEGEVALREGTGMGLQRHEVKALEAYLRTSLEGDEAFQEHRRQSREALSSGLLHLH